jgi:hypothetical protein
VLDRSCKELYYHKILQNRELDIEENRRSRDNGIGEKKKQREFALMTNRYESRFVSLLFLSCCLFRCLLLIGRLSLLLFLLLLLFFIIYRSDKVIIVFLLLTASNDEVYHRQ